jgi:hypothetical protein
MFTKGIYLLALLTYAVEESNEELNALCDLSSKSSNVETCSNCSGRLYPRWERRFLNVDGQTPSINPRDEAGIV